MKFVYGDSYGDVANRELAMDSARDSRFFRSLDARNALAQMAQQQAQQEAANRFQMMQFLARQREAQEATRYNRFQDQQMQQARLSDQGGQNRRFYDELALKKQIADMQHGNAGADQDYNEAYQAITEGALTPEQLPQAFPTIPPNQRNRLATYFSNLANQEQQEIEFGQDDANLLNEQIARKRLQEGIRKATEEAKASKKGFNFSPSEADIDANLATAIQALKAGTGLKNVPLPENVIPEFLEMLVKNRRLSESVKWNPKEERFEARPIPRRFNRSTTPTPVAEPTGFKSSGKPEVDLVLKMVLSGVPYSEAINKVRALRSL